MQGTENIVKFMQIAYSDERLVALLAHAQDGKLAWRSCCCLVGASNAPHALRGEIIEMALGRVLPPGTGHLQKARHSSPIAEKAEEEFFQLGDTDAERRERLIPLIREEMQRRSALQVQPEAVEMSCR